MAPVEWYGIYLASSGMFLAIGTLLAPG